MQNVPLEGPDIDDAFYIFAVQVNSESSTGKRKLTCGKPYYLLDGFKIYEDRILVSKDRYIKTVYDYYIWRFRSEGPQKTDDYFGVKPPKKDPIINKKGRELGSRASIFRSIATQLS